MTLSILAYDEKSGTLGGAATTGSLCVGGWVLRGDIESGLSASQGSLPSTLWGTDVLGMMREGLSAEAAVKRIVEADRGRDERQLAALDLKGSTGAFTGANSIPAAGARRAPHVIVTGNLLASEQVLEAGLDGFLSAPGGMDLRLLAALQAAARVGGDSRGLMSAALLVVGADRPPLSLRIDYAEAPLQALEDLHARATQGAYARWTRHVPTQADPQRAEPFTE